MTDLHASSSAHAHGVFVGRTRELDGLRAGLDAALAGRGGLFMLSGEPGIGKTRLADEVARDAAARGARVLWGRCWEGGGAPPDWPWVQLIREHIDSLAPEVLAAQMGAGAADIAQMVPEIRDRLPDLPAARALEPEQARFRLFDSTTLFLKRAAAQQPLVLVFDDLHAADQPSLRLLQFVSRELRNARILLIGTYRDVEVRRSRSRAPLFADLAREGVQMLLGGLSATEVSTLIERTCQQTLPPAALAVVHQATDGNPFFVDEIARLLRMPDGWNAHLLAEGTVQVPDTVRAAIRSRLAPLAEDTRKVLAVASVIGREFDFSVLAQVIAELASPLVEALDEATAAGVIRDAGGSSRYVFTHALIRETLRHDLPPVRRMQLHREVGEVLERLSANQEDYNLAELAHHFFQAAAMGTAAKAIEYSQRAGAQALQRLAYEDATSHYTRAIEALKFGEPDERRRCDLLLALGDAQQRAGDGTGTNTFHRAASLARQLGAGSQLALAALGVARGSETGEVNDTVVVLLEDALRYLPPDDNRLRAMVLARLAMALYFSPAWDRRTAMSEEAVAMARRLGDRFTLGATLVARHFAIWGPSSVQERLAIMAEILAMGEAAGERDLLMEGYLWQLVDLIESGDGVRFDREWGRFAHAAVAQRVPQYVWHVEMIRAMRALIAGHLEESENASNAALAIGMQAGIARALPFYGVQVFYLRRRQGRLGELEAEIRTFADQFPALPIWRCGLAVLYTEIGRDADARRELARLALNNFGSLPRDGNWLPAMAMVAEACVATQAIPYAEQVYALLLPHVTQNVVISEAIACLGPVAYFLGLLAAALQRWEEAALHFDRALEVNRLLGATLLVAETQHAYGSMLMSRETAGERERGTVLLAESRAAYAALGLTAPGLPPGSLPEPGRMEERSIEDTLAAGPSPSDGGPESIFRHDGDFWTIAYERTVLRLKDSRGLFYISYLLRHPDREFHATDLVIAAQGGDDVSSAIAAAAPELSRRRRGDADAGALLDHQAKAAYKRRLAELKDELEEAQQFNDRGRTERAQQEIDLITHELSAALGLGGRDRAVPSDAERARVAVTKAITLALKSLADGNPGLRRYLGNTIKTGRFCSYTPDPQAAVAWVL